MKKLFVFCLMLAFIAACGGGGGEVPEDDATTPDVSEPAQEVPDEGLPAIIDNYYDEVFKYVEQSLYLGTYSLLAEDCSEMFGVDMDSETVLSNIDAAQINILFFGSDEQFSAASDSEVGSYDVWGYVTEYEGYSCATTIGSTNLGARTADIVAFVCINDDSTEACAAIYQRDASCDFSDQSIKDMSNNNDPKEAMVDAMMNILEVK